MGRLLIFSFCLLICTSALDGGDRTGMVIDTTLVPVKREIQEVRIDSFRNISDYNYQLNPKYESNILKRLWLLVVNKLDQSFKTGTSRFLFKLLEWGLFLLGLTAIIWFLLKRSGSGVFDRSRDKRQIEGEEITESNTLAEIETAIDRAIESEEYRSATRLFFLRSLRILDNADKVKWVSGKTNHDYITELSDPDLQSGFKQLSYIYDYVWYGDFAIRDKQMFDRIRERFISFDTLIKQ